jgi:hypothetical protein
MPHHKTNIKITFKIQINVNFVSPQFNLQDTVEAELKFLMVC